MQMKPYCKQQGNTKIDQNNINKHNNTKSTSEVKILKEEEKQTHSFCDTQVYFQGAATTVHYRGRMSLRGIFFSIKFKIFSLVSSCKTSVFHVHSKTLNINSPSFVLLFYGHINS